ncbi:hypothetical protein SO802_028985 [Lithocarpus litseifolius]|uniref:RNase H type-1 domain-containing protein n=1 Tax=Lithocarpus litseifolius TaxID=425828 RepID=A0AAW2BS95_9ROSI
MFIRYGVFDSLYRFSSLFFESVQGDSVFLAVNSSLVGAASGLLLEAVVDACLTANHHGFHSILFLSDSRGLVKTFNTRKASDRQTHSRLVDLNFLVQNGFLCHMILVPHLLLKSLCSVAKQAIQVLCKLKLPLSIAAVIYGSVAASYEFRHVDFSHVCQQGNCPAHLLAKHTLGIDDFQFG